MDNIHKLRQMIDALFGGSPSRFLPDDIRITYSRKNGRIRSVYKDERLLCTMRTDGGLAITPYFAQMLLQDPEFADNCIEVDDESKPFVQEGKSVFCGHVLKAGSRVRISADVPVLHGGTVIAVGRAVLSAPMIESAKSGLAVRIRDSLKSQKD